MKWYLYLLGITLCLSIAGCPSGGQEAVEFATNPVEAPEYNPAVLSNHWQKEWVYKSPGPGGNNLQTGHSYTLDLRDPQNEYLNIVFGSADNNWAKMRVDARGDDEAITIQFKERLDGIGYDDFTEGNLLLRLERQTDGIHTYWSELKPTYADIDDHCRCFVATD